MENKTGSESNLILINATQSEEVRVAITNGRYLDNLFIEEIGSHRTGNIYFARVTRVVPSLQAAFVDFGSERHGFLPLKEIAPVYFRASSGGSQSVDKICEGQTLIVQVVKEERGNKGAALTTFITLAGSYLVLMPNNPEAGGISHRIEGEDRDQMRETIALLDKPEGMGLIVRTAGLGRAREELKWDLDILLRLWDAINTATENRQPPFLIHQESDIVIRALRDYLRKDITEIIIDSPELYERAKEHTRIVRPEFTHLVKLYQDKITPLFTRYRIEDQIESAFLRDVQLPSGGCIVIEETEAMVTIDVNSARDTKGGNIEQTAFNTNREAAIEIARQLRLRDIGGQIAIDFIDMASTENQQKILDTFKEETRNDKARVQFSRISRFGILEVSRQRLRPSLTESSQIVCPRCNGQGSIRSVESLGLLLLRLIRQEALYDNVVAVNVQVPIDVATFLINEKRHALSEVEAQHHILVRIFPNPHIQTPQYKIERVYETQVGQTGITPSFKQIDKIQFETTTHRETTNSTRQGEPAVKILAAPPKPVVSNKSPQRILARIWSLFSGEGEKITEAETASQAAPVSTDADLEPTSYDKRHRHRNKRQPRPGYGSETSQPQATGVHKQHQQPRHERHQNKPLNNERPALAQQHKPAPENIQSQVPDSQKNLDETEVPQRHQQRQHHKQPTHSQKTSNRQPAEHAAKKNEESLERTSEVSTSAQENRDTGAVRSDTETRSDKKSNETKVNTAQQTSRPIESSINTPRETPVVSNVAKTVDVAGVEPIKQTAAPHDEKTVKSAMPVTTTASEPTLAVQPSASSEGMVTAPVIQPTTDLKPPANRTKSRVPNPSSSTWPAGKNQGALQVIVEPAHESTQVLDLESSSTEQQVVDAPEGSNEQAPKRHTRHYRNRYRQRSNHYRRGNRSGNQEEQDPSHSHELDKIQD
ncbi:MAG: Rne/Rng family ribonuclease [Legionellales bacterium]|nr:Rne/Rng family ribonuclease [Legionellales bacterium]